MEKTIETKIKSAKMLSWQIDCCKMFETLKKGDTMVICSQRQVGKSFTCTQLLLYIAINKQRSTSIYVSPTNDNSRKFFNDIKEMVEASPLCKKLNETLLIIEFKNGSKILFRSAESKLRGYSCKKGGILVVDEAYYVPPTIWEVVLPFTNVDNSIKVIISTPKFKTGMFYNFYKYAVNGDDGYYYINTNEYDTSMFLNERQKEEYRKVLTPNAFRSEILGEWLDDNEGVFGDYEAVMKIPTDLSPEVIGIDWSNNGGDNTVVSGFNKNREQCLLEIVTNIEDPVERVKKIAEIVNRYKNIKSIIVEMNSLGEVYVAMLRRLVTNRNSIVEFVTTNDSKKRIIEKMIVGIKEKTISLLPHPEMKFELSIYELEQLKNGNYTYNGKKDDCIMATAFAIDNFRDGGSFCFGSTK